MLEVSFNNSSIKAKHDMNELLWLDNTSVQVTESFHIINNNRRLKCKGMLFTVCLFVCVARGSV